MSRDDAVYIVDDDAKVRDALSLLMLTANIQARAFATGESFLEAVDLKQPACIVLDVQLPGMSGLELLVRISEMRSKVAVIVVTGHGDVPMAVKAMKSGAHHFVEKPFDPASLLESVEEALMYVEERKDEHSRNSEVEASHGSLTPREQEVMTLIADGLPTKLVATRLGISTRTVEHHRAAVMTKMKARTLSDLVRMAMSMSRATTNAT